jgi:hypothetical protein
MMNFLLKMALNRDLTRATAAADSGERVEINLPDGILAGIFASIFYTGQTDTSPENDIPKVDVTLIDFTWPKHHDDAGYRPTDVDCFKLNMADFFTAVETTAYGERVKNAYPDNRLDPEELAAFIVEVSNA